MSMSRGIPPEANKEPAEMSGQAPDVACGPVFVLRRRGVDRLGTSLGPMLSLRCGNCDKALVKPLRCGVCKMVACCSLQCQKGDWQYNKRLCNNPLESMMNDATHFVLDRMSTSNTTPRASLPSSIGSSSLATSAAEAPHPLLLQPAA